MVSDLLNQLRSAWLSARDLCYAQWNRTLPFGEYVVDRWEKARLLGFGDESSIYDSSVVIGTVSVGSHTWIGPWVMLDGSGGLSIGSHCSISAGVHIYTHDSVNFAISAGEAAIERAPTSIGDNCYIGPNVIIGKGVSIGNGCIVGANSLVLNDLPAGVKAFGTPCRTVGVVC